MHIQDMLLMCIIRSICREGHDLIHLSLTYTPHIDCIDKSIQTWMFIGCGGGMYMDQYNVITSMYTLHDVMYTDAVCDAMCIECSA